MVIEYSFGSLNLYVACSYQPKIQKLVLISCIGNLAGPTSRVAIEIESQFWCLHLCLWVNDSNEKNILEHYHSEFE